MNSADSLLIIECYHFASLKEFVRVASVAALYLFINVTTTF
ncbi:11594_t:CDS:2 [Funneliformis mosseae]|uniref:11594_t:CDS:1 n=1 Tax=Funneliformis mosseae TaxID=27381 RepID=A0A9N9CQH8_FUNMO|nr:11594_t:CDS:2 [Funneliformis mosseae]